ncbi:hypothetical protein WN55_02725 [Dufourea novaeangliae]|uniref:Uncharacterized protein n=1 Tax=Dufourea novaeangliae TaxID=178035 RepID=A0A154NXM6_DUFNO|nr:hypothetical protein WN55_02725 [Dufourea novaeangliae]
MWRNSGGSRGKLDGSGEKFDECGGKLDGNGEKLDECGENRMVLEESWMEMGKIKW